MFVLIIGFLLVAISSASLAKVVFLEGQMKVSMAIRKVARGVIGLVDLALMVFRQSPTSSSKACSMHSKPANSNVFMKKN